MDVLSVIIIVLIFINYFFSIKLYSIPQNKAFFNNINVLNFEKERYITPSPKYVALISIFTGTVIGMYLAIVNMLKTNKLIAIFVITTIFICYLIEITRKIIIKDDKLILTKVFFIRKEFYVNQINGIYIYSYNKKFLKKRALTTKLVVVSKTDKFYKFTLSSLDNKAVLNMIKENFGVSDYKMYIDKKSKQYE